MKGVAKARTTLDQIALAIQTLELLSRRIDNESEESILRTRKWYLERGRADWIITQALQGMQAVDAVIRDLQQWAFALENRTHPKKYENSNSP